MKTLLSIVVVAAAITLTGCAPDKHITEVKALPFSYPSNDVQDPNLTVDQALDYRKVCDSVKWKVDMTEQHQKFVEYQCDYKDVDHSTFLADAVLKAKVERGDKANGEDIVHLVHAGDVYQWTYGPNGSPALSYVAMRLHYSNGTSKDISQTYASSATAFMQLAVQNTATDYDSINAQFTGKPIPPMPTPATEAALRQAYAEAHPRKLSSGELVSLFSPKVIGTSVTQYEALVGKFAGKSVASNPLEDGTAEQTYKFADCFITVNSGQGKILSVTVPLDGGCPVTDVDMPSYLQGKQWDWNKLTVKDVSDLSGKIAGDQALSCVTGLEVVQPACMRLGGAQLTTTIRGSQADGLIDAAFTSRVGDYRSTLNEALLSLERDKGLKEEQVTPAMYNNDPDFMNSVIRQISVASVSTLTLQRGAVDGRNPDVQSSQSMASTTAPSPAPQAEQSAKPTPAAPVTPQVVNSAVAALTGASQPQGQPIANTTVHSGDVGPDGWPKMTPCIQKLQDKFTADQQKQNADTSTSLEQMQEWADVCKSLGQ